MYNAVVQQTKLVGNRSAKVVASNSLYVLKNTNMPALLLENGFMDSVVDIPAILTHVHAVKTASGIISFLVTELQLKKHVAQPVEDNF